MKSPRQTSTIKSRAHRSCTHKLLICPALLLCFTWLHVAGAQPANYTNETVVADYVKGMLYWEHAGAETNSAAFRYKVLLYTNEVSGIRANKENMDILYGTPERTRALQAEGYLRTGLTYNPDSPLLQNLLLDIYYDRTAAEVILAGNEIADAGFTRVVGSGSPGDPVIDDEIVFFNNALDIYRSALAGFFSLLKDDLGLPGQPPAGYEIFQAQVPSRDLAPPSYLSNGVPVSVTGSTEPVFAGYKDFTLLAAGLRDYGRTAGDLIRLHIGRDGSGDVEDAEDQITESQRFLLLQSSTLLDIFSDLDPADTNMVSAASGLAEALQGINECMTDLEALRQSILGGANLLGFEPDFLMLIQRSGDNFDSFDALRERLDPDLSTSPLKQAIALQAGALAAYGTYRGYQDELETQLGNVSDEAEDRLFEIVGARPGEPGYDTPEQNEGSEIWQQNQSIEIARLRIEKNRVEISNVQQEVEIEVNRSADIQGVTIRYGNKQAKLTKWIGHINAAQAAADAIASAGGGLFSLFASGANAAVQAAGEEAKGQLEAEKERLAAQEQAEIEGIESAAHVKTLLLQMNTLAVDSQEAAMLLKQEYGKLTALLREKADLEQTLAENSQNLSGRYFADPVHRLRYQHEILQANLAFNEAQKWLYFLARALEYKWNNPFSNYEHLGSTWSMASLFRLRNADELEQLYNAMIAYDAEAQGGILKDDYFDWFSVREDFFGYTMYDASGSNLMYYADPDNPEVTNLTAIAAFRKKLESKTIVLDENNERIELKFNTVRQIPGGSFFKGPRFLSDGTVHEAGLFLDKIKWMKITLPGNHTLGQTSLSGNLTYGGTSFIRNFDVGYLVPDQPNQLRDEMTAYSTRYWFYHSPSLSWRFNEALSSPVTMEVRPETNAPPSVAEIDVFKERSVAATGWVLSIPTRDLGAEVLRIDELDDIKIYFYHYAVTRPMPSGAAMAMDVMAEETSEAQDIPFPYCLNYNEP